MAGENHRHSERHEGFWKVYLVKDSEEIDLGFLFDLSDDGIMLWIHKEQKDLDKLFSIRIYLPADLGGGQLNLDLELVRKTGLGLSPYIEGGCHFVSLDGDQKILVDKLIEYFDRVKP
ncbi:MAG: PilZ domain-containing protein [Spirochaetota bacterium]|nr:PilZ domain-containing protein [Spirochaetota bacterium]